MELKIETLGGMCPVQGYGTLDGERFYFRYRHDDAQLSVGPAEENGPDPEWYGVMPAHPPRLYAEIRDVTGEEDRGWLDEADAVALIHRLIEMLKPTEQVEGGTYTDRLKATVEALTEAMRKEDLRKADAAAVLDDDLPDL